MTEESALHSSRQTCRECGYSNSEIESRCEKCGRSLRLLERKTAAARTATRGTRAPAPVTPAFPEGLRKQLSSQVSEFRARRRAGTLPLEFGDGGAAAATLRSRVVEFPKPKNEATVAQPAEPHSASDALPASMPSGPDRAVSARTAGPQSELSFPAVPVPIADFTLPPVAPFRLRMISHALDFSLTLAALPFFLAPLKMLAGSAVIDRFFFAGGLVAYCFLALLYGMLFVCGAGATPAMRWMGLRLVNFDGTPASRRQRLWRIFAIVVSAGSFLLGFLWAAVDEEKYYWHDRMSKTFLTPLQPLSANSK